MIFWWIWHDLNGLSGIEEWDYITNNLRQSGAPQNVIILGLQRP